LDWPIPKSIKEVQKFLWLANYYRRFVKDFAKIAILLHNLIRKEVKVRIRDKIRKVVQNVEEMV